MIPAQKDQPLSEVFWRLGNSEAGNQLRETQKSANKAQSVWRLES